MSASQGGGREYDAALEQRVLKKLQKRQKARGHADPVFEPGWDRSRVPPARGAAAGREAAGSKRAEDELEIEGDEAPANTFKNDADAMEDTLYDLPWNYLKVRLDRMNSFSPVHILRYYFVRHSTGFSYLLLLISWVLLAVFIALLVGKQLQTGDQLESTDVLDLEVEEQLTDSLVKRESALSRSTGMRFLFVRDDLNANQTLAAAYVTYEWAQCESSFTRASARAAPSAAGTACTDLGSAALELGGSVFSAAAAQGELDSQFGSTFPLRYVRFRARACSAGCPVDLAASLQGGALEMLAETHGPVELFPELSEGVAPQEFRRQLFFFVAGAPQALQAVYQRNTVVRHARFFVDGQEGNFAQMQRVQSFPLDAGTADLIFEAQFLLQSQRLEVNLKRISFLDLLGQAASLLLVLQSLGLVAWLWNRYHFFRYGTFERADLPESYQRHLFSTSPNEPVVGRREFRLLAVEERYTDTDFKLQQTMKQVADLRAALRAPVERQLQDMLRKDDRA